MPHDIDTTTGRAAMAYVGEAPWHGLGQQLTAGADIETWRREAGLDYSVERAPVHFQRGDDCPFDVMESRHVLYRSDTGKSLSVVSSGYNVVQPGEVLDFFDQLAAAGGFELETAGGLAEGKRVWGLARVSDGAPVVGHDVVRPYLLLATSYDGTMSTVAKFTAIRVVCRNTLTMAVGAGVDDDSGNSDDTGGYGDDGQPRGPRGPGPGQTEDDVTGGAVVQCVRVQHMNKFDPEAVRKQLGIVAGARQRWLAQAQRLAQVSITEAQADQFVFGLLSGVQRAAKGQPLPDVRASRSYKRLMTLFDGAQIGAELCGKGNAWALLNAVTDYVDHERGRSADTRVASAWFGSGEGLKLSAWKALRRLAAQAGAVGEDTTA